MDKGKRTKRGIVVSPSGQRIDVMFSEVADADVWAVDVPVGEVGVWRIYFDNEETKCAKLAAAYDRRPKVKDKGGGLPGEKTPL